MRNRLWCRTEAVGFGSRVRVSDKTIHSRQKQEQSSTSSLLEPFYVVLSFALLKEMFTW